MLAENRRDFTTKWPPIPTTIAKERRVRLGKIIENDKFPPWPVSVVSYHRVKDSGKQWGETREIV